MRHRQRLFVRSLFNYRSFLFILSLSIGLFSGCTRTPDFRSSLYEIDTERISFTKAKDSKVSVSIVNAQQDMRKRELAHGAQGRMGSMGFQRYFGSMNEITQAVVIQLTHELQKRGVDVKKDAANRIQLQVDKTRFTMGAWMNRVDMEVRVKAGKDYVRTFSVSNGTPGTMWRASDGAVALITIDILNDPKIIEYLNN